MTITFRSSEYKINLPTVSAVLLGASRYRDMAFAAKTLKFYLLIWTLLIFENILATDEFHPTAAVWNLSPHVISEMGGVLTIWGKDFAADNFNQFDPMLGNKVCVSH